MPPHRSHHHHRVGQNSNASNASNPPSPSSLRYIGGYQRPASEFAPPGYSPNDPLPSAETEASSFEEVGRWLEQASSSIVGQRKFLNDYIESRCKLQAGQRPPYSQNRHYQSCPDAGYGGNHQYRRPKFIVRTSKQRVTPIGYHQRSCFHKVMNKFLHNVQLTPPLTPHQLRSDSLLWAALRHRISLRPPSLCTYEAAMEEAAMSLGGVIRDETPQPASLGPGPSTTPVPATPPPLFVRSSAQSTPHTTPSTHCSSCGSRNLLTRMNASSPTPPADTRFETDEEQEAADVELLNWRPSLAARSANEKCAKASAPAPPPQAVRKAQ